MTRAARIAAYARAARIAALAGLVLVWIAGEARAAPISIAIAPGAPGVSEGGEGARSAEVLRALAETVRGLPSLVLVSGKLAPNSPAAREPDPIARAQAAGRELKAERALAVDVAPLGDGLVIYLHLVDVASGRELGSATATLADAARLPPDDRARLRGAAVRVLEPSRYVGRVKLRIDVAGAQVVLDGQPVASADQPLALAVGTHALRVTHPAYHDFLRFIDVEFDRPIDLDVALSAYPLSEGQMTEHLKAAAIVVPARLGAPQRERKWRWWVLGGSLLAVAGGTVALVWALRPSVHQDLIVDYRH
jgi:PEGA domain